MKNVNDKVAVQVVLLNKEGKVLGVSRKDNHKDFGLVGGKMDPEDMGDPRNTAIREAKEETGLDISNLQLIFSMHRNGYMGYTYIADWSGEISTDEPHSVEWLPFNGVIDGSTFSFWNSLVAKSLESIGIEFMMEEPSTIEFVYNILEDGLSGNPYISLHSKDSFYSSETLVESYTKEEKEALNKICDENNIKLVEIADTLFEVEFDGKWVTDIKDLRTIMGDAGFILSERLLAMIKNNQV